MIERSIDDRLREEYFKILPNVKRVASQLEAEIKFKLINLSKRLKSYERYEVSSRIKDCESAVEKLRQDQEGGTFDKEKPDEYSLTQLHDLAGVRVLVFPRALVDEVNNILIEHFEDWTSNPMGILDSDANSAYKYYGHASGDNTIYGEVQITPMLTGLFLGVEHFALYKAKPKYKGVAKHPDMNEEKQNVLKALATFEDTFEKLILENEK